MKIIKKAQKEKEIKEATFTRHAKGLLDAAKDLGLSWQDILKTLDKMLKN